MNSKTRTIYCPPSSQVIEVKNENVLCASPNGTEQFGKGGDITGSFGK